MSSEKKTYRVFGWARVGVTMTVEAASEDDAICTAEEGFEGLTGFAGNGGTDKLVGVYGDDVSLDPDGDFEFEEAEAPNEQ